MKTLTVDDRQRVRLPKAKAGQVFAYEPNSERERERGQFVVLSHFLSGLPKRDRR